MTPFLFALYFRIMSGFQNGAGYGKDWTSMIRATALMLLCIGFTFYFFSGWSMYFLIPASIATILMPILLSNPKRHKWVHLTETAITGAYTLTLIFIAPMPVVFALYPGLVGHKIGVNIMAGNAWNYNGTDDATGATWTLHIFDWSISVPRFSFTTRLILAGVSVAGFVVWMYI